MYSPPVTYIVLFEGALRVNHKRYDLGSPGDQPEVPSPGDPIYGSPTPASPYPYFSQANDTETYRQIRSDELQAQGVNLPGTYGSPGVALEEIAPVSLIYELGTSPTSYFVVGYLREHVRTQQRVRLFMVAATEGEAQARFPEFTVDSNIPVS